MHLTKLIEAAILATICFAGIVVASPPAQDHNTTRSNRGTIVATGDTDKTIGKKPAGNAQTVAPSLEGRNPQTGKEINKAKNKKRTGRNPQTGKEIQIAPGK